MKALIVFLILTISSSAGADDGRKFGLFLGAGLGRSWASVKQPGVNASLTGGGSTIEAGIDVPFVKTFGMTFSVEIAEFILENTYKNNDYLDRTTIRSRGARGGFFFKNLGLGYGMRQLNIDVRSVSVTSGASQAQLEGEGSFGYASFSIDFKKLMRGSLEVQANSSKLNNFEYTDYQVGLRAYMLLNGFLD